jgi:hypothetical protein
VVKKDPSTPESEKYLTLLMFIEAKGFICRHLKVDRAIIFAIRY